MAQSWTDSQAPLPEDERQSSGSADNVDISDFFFSEDNADTFSSFDMDSTTTFLASSSHEDTSKVDALGRSCSSDGSVSPSRQPSSSSTESGTTSRSQVEEMATSGLWVFGYGSLCWHQGFDFSDSMTGFVMGFSRRFWQGNITHRGIDGKPGRVATLVEDSEGIVWGQAFQVRGEAALPYLNNRECELGGYRTTLATFHPRDRSVAPFPAVLYVATPSNRHWLGDGPLHSIADQIVESKGPSGHNVEYLLRLADFVRDRVPEAADEHLFGLEALVRDKVLERRLCLSTLMGEGPGKAPVQPAAHAAAPAPLANAPPSPSAQFSNRVPTKKLRCVNI